MIAYFYISGIEAVVTMVIYIPEETFEGVDIVEALQKLEKAGAAVVGLNCGRGPKTMIPLLRRIKQSIKARKFYRPLLIWPC